MTGQPMASGEKQTRTPSFHGGVVALVAILILTLYSFIVPLYTPNGFYLNAGYVPHTPFMALLILCLVPMAAKNTALIFILTFATGSIVSSSLAQYFYPFLAQLIYKASPQNQWAEFLKYIPSRLLPAGDANSPAIKYMWEGLPRGESIPWGAWLVPLAAWTTFFVLLFFVYFCMACILRRQLVEREILEFPTVRPSVELLRRLDSGPAKESLIGGKAFWIAFGGICLLALLEPSNIPSFVRKAPYLGEVVERLPKFRTGTMMGNVFGHKPWNALNRTVFLWIPFFVALFYLLPAQTSFSIWFFYLLTNKLMPVIGTQLGFTLKQPGNNSDYEFVKDLSKGGLILFVCFFLWNARGHLGAVIRKAVRPKHGADDSDEPVPYAIAVWGMLLAIAGLVAWCVWNGMSVGYAFLVLVIFFFMLSFLAKQTGETAIPFGHFNYMPQDMVTTVVGPAMISRVNLVMTHLLQMINMYQPPVMMPNMLQGMKVAHEMRLYLRRIALWLLPAFAVGILASHILYIAMAYDAGIGKNIRHDHRVYMEAFGTGVVHDLKSDKGGEPLGIMWMGLGAVSTFGIMMMRQTFLWWPFNPIGLIVATYPWIFQTWFMFFLAWLGKAIVVRVGGARVYRASLRVVFGIIIGSSALGIPLSIIRIIESIWAS